MRRFAALNCVAFILKKRAERFSLSLSTCLARRSARARRAEFGALAEHTSRSAGRRPVQPRRLRFPALYTYLPWGEGKGDALLRNSTPNCRRRHASRRRRARL